MDNVMEREKTMIITDNYKNNNGRKKTMILEEDESQGRKKTLLLQDYIIETPILKEMETNLNLLNGKYRIKELLTDDSGEADIYIAEYNNEKYIVKLYRTRYKHNEDKSKRIKAIKSPYVIKIIDEGIYRERFFEIMTYYENGDLSRYELSQTFVKEIVVRNLIEALKEIHENKLIHRDIKPSNIFLSNDKSHVILGDFGISSVLGDKVTSKKTSKAKTLEYSAIETFNDIVTNASDYYSLGITIMEILTGRTSYEGLTDMEITKRKALNQFDIPLDKSNEFYTLIKGLTNFSSSNRWQFDEVSRWLKGEFVEIKEDRLDIEFSRPYKFNGKSITNKKDLALELSLNWSEGKKNFIRGYLSGYFTTIDQELACKIEDLVEIVNNNPNRFDTEYFKAIHTIYPGTQLIWCGEDLEDVSNLIKLMKRKSINENMVYCDFVFNGALEYYLEINNALTESIDAIKELSELSKMFFNRAYYGFLLLDNNEFYYRGRVLNNTNDLIDFISENIADSEEIAAELEQSDYFSMWMKKIGNGYLYDKYISD
ncbi:protein kinase domain-containing protein [Clostridium perfringens]|uniref:protein kinase domain-containing protein n=1 Tax=Clostridium perfringens TaxID=1502 RepID=UPI001C86047B|nr:protein kinase [Clostridium perfringens]MDK0573618.1 protein kinase [Clostridium perfringens]MDK0918462.1 protein kinase [Clostridium perfringens]